MKKQTLLLSLAALAMAALSAPAHADFRTEKKIMQFGGPETRTRCIKLWKTKGIPACSMRGLEIRCEDRWMSGCSEWATDFYQHEIFLVATGPDVDEALRQYAAEALEHSLVAAAAAAVATPGEVAIKASAAVTAFKAMLIVEFSKISGLANLGNKFEMTLEERGHW